MRNFTIPDINSYLGILLYAGADRDNFTVIDDL